MEQFTQLTLRRHYKASYICIIIFIYFTTRYMPFTIILPSPAKKLVRGYHPSCQLGLRRSMRKNL